MKTLIASPPWVTVLVSTVLSAVAAGLFEYFITGGVAGWVPLMGGLVGGGVTTLVHLVMGKPEQHMQKQPEYVGNRAFSQRSVHQLINLTKGLMEIEAEAVTKRYIGTWLRVRGRVDNVFDSSVPGGGVWVSLLQRSHSFLGFLAGLDNRIIGYFYASGQEQETVRTLVRGSKITVVGQIKSINQMAISLEGCELVDK